MATTKKAERIAWIGQDNFYGLDHVSKSGRFKDFVFQIHYDYDGNPREKPNCGLWLTVLFKQNRLKMISGKSISKLMESAEEYLSEFIAEYASLQISELIEAVEKVRELLNRNVPAQLKTDLDHGLSYGLELGIELLDELLKAHKPTPPISG